jgi:hypothetical protein
LSVLYQEIAAAEISPKEQRELQALVRNRLLRTSKALERQLQQKANPPAPRNRRLPPAPPPLAQVRPNAAGAGPNAAPARANPLAGPAAGVQPGGGWDAMTAQNAQQLIDLIQATIAPASWDVNGGPGTIMYFAPRQVLVVRQGGDVHEQVGAAIRGLRGN